MFVLHHGNLWACTCVFARMCTLVRRPSVHLVCADRAVLLLHVQAACLCASFGAHALLSWRADSLAARSSSYTGISSGGGYCVVIHTVPHPLYAAVVVTKW